MKGVMKGQSEVGQENRSGNVVSKMKNTQYSREFVGRGQHSGMGMLATPGMQQCD